MMTNIEAINYLRRRLSLSNQGRFNEFNTDDVIFIRNYIHHSSGQLISQEKIVNSIHHSLRWSEQFDNMLNHVIQSFKIKVKWAKLEPPLQIGFEVFHVKVIGYESN
jgi:hypothetical protein